MKKYLVEVNNSVKNLTEYPEGLLTNGHFFVAKSLFECG